jgi:hypothetical protein
MADKGFYKRKWDLEFKEINGKTWTLIYIKVKQSFTGPECPRKFRLKDFETVGIRRW